MNVRKMLMMLAAAALLAACGGPQSREATKLDPGTVMLFDLSAHHVGGAESAYCTKGADGTWVSDESEVERGEVEDSHFWSQGGGCVARPIEEVWAVTHNQPVMVWNEIDESSFTVEPPQAPFSHAYSVLYVKKAFITVDWTMLWTHAVAQGTPESPEVVVVNYQRTEGTQYLPYWEGTIVLEKLDENTTGVTIRNQINAARMDTDQVASTIGSILERLRTGEPNVEGMKAKPAAQ